MDDFQQSTDETKSTRFVHLYPGLRVLLYISLIELIIFITCIFLIAKYEGLSMYEAFYMAVITVFTVGYGDITPQTTAGQKTVILMVVTGVGYISFFSSLLVTTLIEGKILHLWSEIVMERKISRLRNHIIVCSLGRAGSAAIRRLQKEGIACVGIDINEERCKILRDQGHLTLLGDATEDAVLEKAGIKRATAVITALPEDGDNILITMAAKDLNKNIRVVARADKKENETRLRRAGADWVTVVGLPAGTRLAMAAVKPITSDFVQTFLDEYSLKLEEFFIEKDCPLANKAIKDINLREKYGMHILAVVRNKQTLANPSADEKILPGDIIIVFGTPDEMEKAEKILGFSCPLKL
ncbi:voltage-gated potassium channel [Desulfohalotomaculum tongense]|uniref:potassium channel family protein n=1 Tax=Desulforadius tongensis TaxID=1216062 RepID=UPI00195D1AA7|nr:potassium channel protein [Desulforadius tongensis]MBM7854560.1 voltage-gated potassium channel [Desulforadius tongensis]